MKEYIFNALTENHYIAQRVWNGYIEMGVWFPVFIVVVILLILQYKRLKKKKVVYENWEEVLYDNPKYLAIVIPLIFAIGYILWLVVDVVILYNSIILYEIKH